MRICLFALAALVAGCHWSLNSKSTDPQSDQLYFPAGIAMDPAGQYVYVSNGNADLRYGGGTVMMVDMLSFECTVAAYRLLHPLNDADAQVVPPATCSSRSLDEWQHLAEFDYLCRRDALDPTIVECDESGFILQNSTVSVGNFAGAIRLARDPNDANHRTLFVAVRGDPSITRIDVRFPTDPSHPPTDNPGFKGSAYAPMNINDPGVLQCVASPSTLATRKQYDPATHKTSAPAPCEATSLVQDYYCQNQPTCTVGVNNNGKTQLPGEPFGMVIDSSLPLDSTTGLPDPSKPTRRLVVSHLATGQISVIDVDAAPSQALLSESSQFFPADATGRHGAFALAQQNPTDHHSLWYVTSSVNPLIATFRIADANVVTVTAQSSFGLNNTFAQGTDVRDFVFDTGGNRAFVTENNPPSLLVLDTRTDDTEGSQPHNIVTDVVDVCQTPSHTGVRRLLVAGAPGTPPQVKTKVVVVCFLSNQVMIVDPDRPGVDDTIYSGFSGPNDIAFNFSDAGSSEPIADVGLARHAYVTNYSESTIAVVDLEPGSPTENHVLARLGHPSDGFNP